MEIIKTIQSFIGTNDRSPIVCGIGDQKNIWYPHSSSTRRSKSMQQYTTRELSDMYLVYGFANGNARVPERLHRERFWQRDVLGHFLFTHVHYNFCEYGPLSGNRQSEGSNSCASIEQTVLDAIETNLSASIPAVAAAVSVSGNILQRVLRAEFLRPYHC